MGKRLAFDSEGKDITCMKEFDALAYPCKECNRTDCEEREYDTPFQGAYIYESHMGGLYTSDEPLEYDDLYCEECGDSDRLLGYAETRSEAMKLLLPDGWDSDYARKFVENNWDS